MRFASELAGPHRPLTATPPRRAGWIRRTTTVDASRPDGVTGPVTLDARGRDLRTTGATGTDPVASARFVVRCDLAGSVGSIEAVPAGAEPGDLALDELVGASVRAGFRRHVGRVAADDAAGGGLWHLLLDDLVGALLVSGIAQQHDETLAGGGPMHDGVYANLDAMFTSQAGVCAGWDADASMLREVREVGWLPVPVGPPAPDLERADPLGWHEVAALAPHTVRRRRRLDVGPPDRTATAEVEGHFRDSHVDRDGVERCVHEYTFEGRLDTAAGVLVALDAEARVLPWVECPEAVASAGWVVGVPLDQVRDWARGTLRGVSTCTHLNDVVRSLADLPHLV